MFPIAITKGYSKGRTNIMRVKTCPEKWHWFSFAKVKENFPLLGHDLTEN
jgi:hypothetical protein